MEVACDFQSMGRYATARLKWASPTFGNNGKRFDIISENLSEFMFENIFGTNFGEMVLRKVVNGDDVYDAKFSDDQANMKICRPTPENLLVERCINCLAQFCPALAFTSTPDGVEEMILKVIVFTLFSLDQFCHIFSCKA